MEEPQSRKYSGPYVNFPHIPFSDGWAYGIYGSSGQGNFTVQLTQMNYRHWSLQDPATGHIIVDPNAVGSEYEGFDDYTNGTYTSC